MIYRTGRNCFMFSMPARSMGLEACSGKLVDLEVLFASEQDDG